MPYVWLVLLCVDTMSQWLVSTFLHTMPYVLWLLSPSLDTMCSLSGLCVVSLACEKPFDGAQGNIKRLFEKNQTRLQHRNHAARDLPPDMQR